MQWLAVRKRHSCRGSFYLPSPITPITHLLLLCKGGKARVISSSASFTITIPPLTLLQAFLPLAVQGIWRKAQALWGKEHACIVGNTGQACRGLAPVSFFPFFFLTTKGKLDNFKRKESREPLIFLGPSTLHRAHLQKSLF